MAANLVFKNGFYKTKSQSFDDQKLKEALFRFIEREPKYTSCFAQHHFEYGFDGYSFMGQTDSSNQYASDLLHSFVLSDFVDSSKFPEEFDSFYSDGWNLFQSKIREIERALILKLNYPGLMAFYEEHIGHMISCNYYPKVPCKTSHNNRLSEHTDVSLFTIFPFGFGNDFFFETKSGTWLNIPATDEIVVFPGYLLEKFTQGKYPALNHKVGLPMSKNQERFSFAYFSLPYPKHHFQLGHKNWTSETYFKSYLDLF